MAPGPFRFGGFSLDPANRRLSRGEETVELNARYFDALVLLVREQGRLVSKDRFLDEVWRGVPVTDEALTQCIRTIRRQLGDDAVRPRFIETAPKHGYRFIAPLASDDATEPAPRVVAEAAPNLPSTAWSRLWPLGVAGAVGGAGAGLVGGLIYGLAAAQPLESGGVGGSTVLVLMAITALVGFMGGAGVGLGVAGAGLASRHHGLWSVIGGAWGGMVVGAVVKLIGVDAFSLLFGQSPGEITGAAEGGLLGGAVGLAAWLTTRGHALSPRRGMALGALIGGAAGVAIALVGGRLMGGSLVLLAERFPGSRLDLDRIGALFGEEGFGLVTRTVTSGLEAALFSACVVGAVILARRRSA
jgi:DNA-binding winged helix-turn-helix (wHTH) protein